MRTEGEIKNACDLFARMLMEMKVGGMDWHAMTASVGVCKWILGESPYSESMDDMLKEMKKFLDKPTAIDMKRTKG